MGLRWPHKDPDEVLDYQIDWARRLGEDTIASVEWDVPDGLTKDDEDNTTTTTTVWLSSGALGETYSVHCRITTTDGRIMDQSVTLAVRAK